MANSTAKSPLPNKNVFNAVSSIASGSNTQVVVYTVPAGKTFFLDLIEFSGQNIATFQVVVNSSVEAQKETYFSGPLYGEFKFEKLKFTSGDVIELKVEHQRSETGDFNGRILGSEV